MGALVGIAILILTWSSLIEFSLRAAPLASTTLRRSVVGLMILSATAIFGLLLLSISGMRCIHSRSAPVPRLRVARTPGRLQRGQVIVNTYCNACHSTTDTLTGGFDMGNEFPIHAGSFVASNLTPAGELRHWSDGQIFRAIRDAIDADGRWLIVMSYMNARMLSDEDIESVIAYVRSVPAAGAATEDPPDDFNLLGLIMLGAGKFPAANPAFTSVITASHRNRHIPGMQIQRLLH
jgi:mono/diheme cytochrome c family protein